MMMMMMMMMMMIIILYGSLFVTNFNCNKNRYKLNEYVLTILVQ